jgi:transposase
VNGGGIDLAGVSSFAEVSDEKGRKVWSGPVETEKNAFGRLVKQFGSGGLWIAIEAGNQTAWLVEILTKWGAQVTVVNPAKVKPIAESRRKTDKIDAKMLCELLRLDSLACPVYLPGPEARALRDCWWPGGSCDRLPIAQKRTRL